MVVPNLGQNSEADSEGHKALHSHNQFSEGLWHLQGNYQKGDSESEDRVRKPFQARNLAAAPAEVFFRGNELSDGITHRGAYCAMASMAASEGISLPSSPSQRAITPVARQFPRTLVAVRAISIS